MTLKLRAAVLFAVLAAPALAQPSPIRTVGRQANGSIIASDNQVLTPAGRVVALGAPVIAKAVAVDPAGAFGAVLQMGAAAPVAVFSTQTGRVLQRFVPGVEAGGISADNPEASFTGISYTPDGRHLLFSQDNNFLTIADIDAGTGLLTGSASVALPPPPAVPGRFNRFSANPGGIAVTADGRTALVALNANNAVGVVDLAGHALMAQIPVGNAPNRIVIHGKFAYVSNEGGRPAVSGDFTNLSDGTAIVADRTDAFAVTGTVSVIDIAARRQVASIDVGLHPAGMTIAGDLLYVANSYSDSISVIDTAGNRVIRTIGIGVPVAGGAFGAGPNDIVVDGTTAYVTLGQCNAVAALDVSGRLLGYIPALYFPSAIAFDAAHRQLVVADGKGTGARGVIAMSHGVAGYNTHMEAGTVSLISVPSAAQLAADTRQVIRNDGWQADAGAAAAAPVDAHAAPAAVPVRAGEPSLIRHVFLFIKENRTYDQVLGDLPQGNGDAGLAIFARDTPNQHELIKRFPLLDNVYAPSRQSADGHPWIVESGSFYSNEIQSADWIRSYPGGNSNDALTYTPRGFLWSAAEKAGLSVRLYGEWSEDSVVAKKPGGGVYSWADFYNTHLYAASGGKQGANAVPADADSETTAVPSAKSILDPHYPSFNLIIPDQNRADYYIAALEAQDKAGAVPAFSIIWLPDDHTAGLHTGLPLPGSYQADNDLALGRMVEAISHSRAWPGSAIFVEEDDAQDGVDHVDGHRQPVYVISPFAAKPQAPGVGRVIHTLYTQENINRTIENMLGLPPLTQFDLVASPMFDVFQNTADDAAFVHVPAVTPLNVGPGGVPIAGTGAASTAMNGMSPVERAWNRASDGMLAGKLDRADAVDEDFLNHATWYSATGWVRPYPGEARVRLPAGLTVLPIK